MAGIPGDPSHHGLMERVAHIFPHERPEEAGRPGSSWYLSRKEIEENSPSRRDGIDLKKEAYLRKSYCTYLQDLGMRLKVPQVTIATAIIFCHRFFLRQSHAKNDRRTIATVCMFLAGKVEETPRPLKDVILVSYEIIHKKDPAAVQRIKQRDVYEQQKELVLLGERVLLATLGFDLNVHHPYKPLVEAIKRFKVAQNALAQVAWNFVNDGLRTSLCLQFKPHHIAAGAIFLAAKFLKVKLPSDGEKSWWQEFDVTPRQLEEVSNQMLELYEQNRATPPSHGNEAEENSGMSSQAPGKNLAVPVESASQMGHSQTAVAASGKHFMTATSRPVTDHSAAQLVTDYSHLEQQNGLQKAVQDEGNGHGAKEPRVAIRDHKLDIGSKDHRYQELGSVAESSDGRPNYGSDRTVEDSRRSDMGGAREAKQWNAGYAEAPKDYSTVDAIKKIDKDRVKAALEKRRKSRPDASRKMDLIDEDDLIERELENGVELAAEDEKIKHYRRQNWSKPLNRQEPLNLDPGLEHGNIGTELDTENAEEGELPSDSREFRSPEVGSRKRKAESPHKLLKEKEGSDFPRYHVPYPKHRDALEGRSMLGRHNHGERDHEKHG